jgi:hypothetical protein
MKLADLVSDYIEKHKAIDNNEAKIEAREAMVKKKEIQIAKLEAEIKKLKEKNNLINQKNYWVDKLVRPLAEELKQYFPDHDLELMGPFGICSTVCINFFKKGIPGKERWKSGNCLSLDVRPQALEDGPGFSWVGLHTNTGEFAKDTIGEINGMNFPEHRIDPEMDVKELVPLFK